MKFIRYRHSSSGGPGRQRPGAPGDFASRSERPAFLQWLASRRTVGVVLRHVGIAALCTGLVLGCLRQTQHVVESSSSEEAASAVSKKPAPPIKSSFRLRSEPSWPCAQSDVIDVNRGESPAVFINAAHCQVTGKPAPASVVKEWSQKMKEHSYVRRIDVVHGLCKANDREKDCKLSYSDPWQRQLELVGPPEKNAKRDIGAVFMFFFNCPDDTNCKMDWANTHAPGMSEKVEIMGFGDEPKGYYAPESPGFWHRELLDAQYAGLQFLLLNTYGPDIEDGKLKPLTDALASIDDPIKIALMDDTWTWGEPWFSDFWKQKPNLRETEATAKLLYEAKWKPFFSQIDEKHWYRFDGKPFIYFYNAGKLEPRSQSAKVLKKMKELFAADFGTEPFLDADSAFFEDRTMKMVANAEFKWFTFQTSGKRYRSTLGGHTIDHAMVKWDAVGRDRPGDMATASDLVIKDSALLERILEDSKDADILVLATWNDLGEGTGINRNYDYYAGGQWLPPDHFINLIRRSQGEN